MSDFHAVRWLARELDQRLLKNIDLHPQRDRLDMSADGDTVVIRSHPAGYSESVGARRLLLIGMLGLLAAAAIVAGVVVAVMTRPDDSPLAVIGVSSVVVILIAALAVSALKSSVAAAREAVEIRCSRREVSVKRLESAERVRDFTIPADRIAAATVVDQFFVALELLVTTDDHRVHRLLSGLRRDELERAAAVIRGVHRDLPT